MPFLLALIIFSTLIIYLFNFTTILQKQKHQLFEQYKFLTTILIDSNVDIEEYQTLKEVLSTKYPVYNIGVSHLKTKLIMGWDVTEVYRISGADWDDLSLKLGDFIPIKKRLKFDQKPFALVTNSLCNSPYTQNHTLTLRDEKYESDGVIDTKTKLGLVVGNMGGTLGFFGFKFFVN